ncbi:hypothetical protein EVAR_94063_1 [Eumeta japonica]|uniref:Uncharacterized protein n=1 Tax=Eumeta variegata TaxID=151549 RepID=A0A4C1V6C0_EUMVA|nr:hypothetical protein EVAR_94063_1 [Eumeta japonica]
MKAVESKTTSRRLACASHCKGNYRRMGEKRLEDSRMKIKLTTERVGFSVGTMYNIIYNKLHVCNVTMSAGAASELNAHGISDGVLEKRRKLKLNH